MKESSPPSLRFVFIFIMILTIFLSQGCGGAGGEGTTDQGSSLLSDTDLDQGSSLLSDTDLDQGSPVYSAPPSEDETETAATDQEILNNPDNGSGGTGDSGIPDSGSGSGEPGVTLLSWVAPTTNNDGTDLIDLAGFRLYVSQTTPISTLDSLRYSLNSDTTTYQFTDLEPGQYYFAVSAFDASGNESELSSEVSKLISSS